MGTDLNHLVLFNEFKRISNLIFCKTNLIVCLYVHEVVQITIIIQILHIYTLNTCSREFLCWTERLLKN